MKELLKRKYMQNIIAVAGAILLTVIIELCFHMKQLTLSSSDKGNRDIALDNCTTENIDRRDDGNLLIHKDESATISFDVNGYVDRLAISYETEGVLVQSLLVNYINMYGVTETKIIEDVNPVYLDETVVNIREQVESVTLVVEEHENDITIKSVSIRNACVINWIRVAFFFLGLITFAMIFVWRKLIAEKIEIGFAIVAGSIGLAMVIAMPLVRVGFDEEAHFRNSFVLSFESTTEENETLWNMLNTVDANHPEYRTASYEEYVAFRKYLNENALYVNNGEDEFRLTARTTSSMPTFAYVFMAFGINIARLFKMDFGNIYMFARLVNLITYVITMFFAIKVLKKGKLLLATIGLMPTVMFLSTTISYDPVIIGFTALGLSFLLNEFINDEENITWKRYLLGCGFLGYGSLAKAIYAPMFLMGLFLPKTKFKDKKTRIIMKTGFVVCFAVLMLTAVLPLVMGQDGGDDRGGDTSHMGQLSYMFSNIFGYAGLLFKSIGKNLFGFSVGATTLDNMYFMGCGVFIVPLVMLLAVVMFTQGEDGFNFKLKYRLAMGGCIFVSVALIWTSMYMAFTEAGTAGSINGVQGRYFIPLLFTGLSLFGTTKIKCSWKKKYFYPAVLSIMAFVLCFELYSQIILNSCA